MTNIWLAVSRSLGLEFRWSRWGRSGAGASRTRQLQMSTKPSSVKIFKGLHDPSRPFPCLQSYFCSTCMSDRCNAGGLNLFCRYGVIVSIAIISLLRCVFSVVPSMLVNMALHLSCRRFRYELPVPTSFLLTFVFMLLSSYSGDILLLLKRRPLSSLPVLDRQHGLRPLLTSSKSSQAVLQ